jgi:hypothetical protein
MQTLSTIFGLTLVLAASAASAQPIMPARQGIDANTFIVGHPASPRWRVVHANAEHPAVLQARNAAHGAIDPNTFIVQPPASVTWLDSSEVQAPVLVAAKR